MKEEEIREILSLLKKDGMWIALSLWPPKDSTIIEKQGNRMYINEGRDGEFEGVSEKFYDDMVIQFDSRYKN